MSDTPRTDAEYEFVNGMQLVPAEFARQLERELAKSRNAALEEAAALVDCHIDPQNAWITGNDIRALKEKK